MTLRKKFASFGLAGILGLTSAFISSGCGDLKDYDWNKPIESKSMPELDKKEEVNNSNSYNNPSQGRLTWEQVKNTEVKSPIDIFEIIKGIEYVMEDGSVEDLRSAKETVESGEANYVSFSVLRAYLGEKIPNHKPMVLAFIGYNRNNGQVKPIEHMATLLEKKTDSGNRYIALDFTCYADSSSLKETIKILNENYVQHGTEMTHYAVMDLSKVRKTDWREGKGNLSSRIVGEIYNNKLVFPTP
tara:strand:- start:1981 stop:2712 length:732 start_codon:yes stop_codon:yes gene_type:complete